MSVLGLYRSPLAESLRMMSLVSSGAMPFSSASYMMFVRDAPEVPPVARTMPRITWEFVLSSWL